MKEVGDQVFAAWHSLSNADVDNSGKAVLAYLESRHEADTDKNHGIIGFCMSGAFVTSSLAHIPKTAISVGCYGVYVATDKPDSPHLFADKMKVNCTLLRHSSMNG
eukprot:TRINITY_DN17553_c0_g1_i1.p2 TRINITY_DN17553_c0_g1~~TRINITY_DN17553_c0_g1_i1.p2  ORF type:complete len:106 (-),score=5.94 TRINITY_DN17553_c0_g1_i1:61-378(-)